MHFSIIEQAKIQDDEREIQKDEQIYKTTGKNMAYDEKVADPLVPIGGYYSSEKPLTNAQRAKVRRMIEKQKELTETRQEKTEEKIKKHKNDFENGISFLEIQ